MAILDFSPATVAVGLALLLLVALAVRRLWRNGMCDCHSDSPRGGCAGGCSGCAGCGAADKMIAGLDGLSSGDANAKRALR